MGAVETAEPSELPEPLFAHATAREKAQVLAGLSLVHDLILRAGEREED